MDPCNENTECGEKRDRPVLVSSESNANKNKEKKKLSKENIPLDRTTKEPREEKIEHIYSARKHNLDSKIKEHDHMLKNMDTMVRNLTTKTDLRINRLHSELVKEIGSVQAKTSSALQFIKEDGTELKIAMRAELSRTAISEEENRCRFIETNGYKTVFNILQGNNMVILTGLPGDGKTCLSYHCATDFEIYRMMKPFIVQYHDDWKTCISPNKNLFLIIEDFCEEDVFSETFFQNVCHHLEGIASNVGIGCDKSANKVILNLRKEVLQLVRPRLEHLSGFSEGIIVDLSLTDTNYSLSPQEKMKMLEKYCVHIHQESIEQILDSVSFGFPRFCQSNVNLNYHVQGKESLPMNAFENMEPEFLLVLTVVCLKGGKVSVNELSEQVSKWPNLFTIFTETELRLGRNISQKLVLAARLLTDVYLCTVTESEGLYVKFKHTNIHNSVASFILKKRPDVVFQLVPYEELKFFRKLILSDSINVTDEQVFHLVSKRISSDLCSNVNIHIIEEISHLVEWNNDDFINACFRENGNISKSISNLQLPELGHFLVCATKAKAIGLLRLLIGNLQLQTFHNLCQEFGLILQACKVGSIEIFQLLRDMGVAIHDDGLFLNTVLVPATEQNQISFLSHVIDEFPMALKLKDPEGFSLLHLGAKYALMGMVDFFIGKGFNPNERSYRGETVLHILAMHGSITNVKWFSCRYPQHVTMLTTTGKSVLHYAVSNRDAEVMLYFVRDVKMIPHEETYNKETLLHLACESGNSLLVRHILDLYPEMMNSQDANGCTAFQTACINGDLETVKILCDHREFNLELLSTGENVLGSVCKSKQIDTFTYLLHAFPELLNEESGGGYTLLHIASAFSTVDIVNYLTNHGFNVQRRTTSGRNALHVACSSGNFEVVRFMTWRYPELLKAVDNDGYDAMLCAAESKSMETVKYLIDKGYFRKQTSHSGQNIFHISCRESTVEIVKYLYQNYPQDFVEHDKLGQLPIHFSAMNTCLQVIQFCLSLNVDVYATSLVNRTILHYACSNRNTDVLKYVLKTVPGLRHRRDINGYNAIHCSCETNNKEAFEFLLKEGFEIHSKTFDDFTVLDLAFLHRSMSIVATIMDKYKRGKYDNFMDMISHRIAQYENHILARLKKFEYIDFAVFPLRRVDTKFKYSNVSSLVDLHFTNQEKSVFQKETTVNKTFKRMLALSKIEEEIDMTFQELLIEVGLTQVELWYINLAFLFPEHMPDAWISSFLERIKSCELSSVLKAAAYGICRTFTNAFYRVLSIQSVWAGYTYSTLKGHLNSQLDTIVVITNEENGNVQLKMKEYLGLKLYFRNADKCSHEAKEIMCYENENLSSIHLQQEDIQRLLSSHSNITLISASSVKSKGYGKPYQEPPVKQHTIVIYCRVKGIIPVGEMRFPTEIGGYPVDVRESVVTFAAGHEGVRIGDKIGPTEESITGTLGGFIDLDSGKKGFITCAHVVCSKFLDNQNALQNIAEQNISVGVVEEKGKRRIGKVNKAYFNLDQVTKTSIDAALIELNDSLPETGQFSLKVKTEDYRKAGFQQHHIPSFSNGEISKVPDINLKMFLKIGAVSGLTCGFLHFKDPAAVIGTTPHNVYIHKNKYELHGQIEVKPHRCETFIEKGDSGAFVFSLEMDDAPILRCIGMVEAITDHGTCLVTPIQDVLSALGLSIYHLTKFERELQEHDKEDFLSRMFDDLRRRMESMQNDMQEMKIKVDTTTESVSKIQTDMSNMQNEMTSVHEKLDLIDKSTLTTSTDDPQM